MKDSQRKAIHANIAKGKNKTKKTGLKRSKTIKGKGKHGHTIGRPHKSGRPVERYQTGTRKSIHLDRTHKAKPPGKRKSDITGDEYTERRRNRSDIKSKIGWI